jgi:cellulose synthase/poly-beta-1,6-N-acetylglucosamine synthase-like glycosyltransferase
MSELSTIARALFWVCVVVVAYVYAGYPILLGLLARLFPRNIHPVEEFCPSVSLLISVYNEAAVIRKKIGNTLQLEYPKSLFEIIVISDCSSDATDDIVSEYADRGVRLIRQSDRLGKSSGLNLAVPLARGEVVIFSDANAMYRADAVQNCVRHFVDPKIGYVVGNARYVESVGDSQSSQSEGLYWKLETWLKSKESDFESVVGGDGAIYAIRRQLYSPLLPTDINDFLNPLQIINCGYRGLFDSSVVCFEETADTFAQEFRRKVRIVSRALNAVRRAPGVLNPLRNPRHFWLLASHKILRWFAPFFLVGLVLTSLTMYRFIFYRWAAGAQIAFYLLALVGWGMQSRVRVPRPVSLACYFCVVNLASFIGCIKCLRGNLSGTWTPHRSAGHNLSAR